MWAVKLSGKDGFLWATWRQGLSM